MCFRSYHTSAAWASRHILVVNNGRMCFWRDGLVVTAAERWVPSPPSRLSSLDLVYDIADDIRMNDNGHKHNAAGDEVHGVR